MDKTHPQIQWLLESDLASIRYLSLKNLLNKAGNDPEVKAAFQAIQSEGPVPEILDAQAAKGQWEKVGHYYTYKYTSTHWSMLLLSELQVDPANQKFQNGVDYMLDATKEVIYNGLHGIAPKDKRSLDVGKSDLTCLWSNILRYCLYAGRWDDERLQNMIQFSALAARDRDGYCNHNGNLSCIWGVLRTLWAFALIPENKRSDLVQQAMQRGVDFLVNDYDLTKANYPTPADAPHEVWFKPAFPLFYQSDILMALRVLAELDQLHQPKAQPALDWLESLRKKEGTWRGTSPYSSRTWKGVGKPKETNRWVTYLAAYILEQANRPL